MTPSIPAWRHRLAAIVLASTLVAAAREANAEPPPVGLPPDAPPPGPPPGGWAPDPTPLPSKKQWVFDISVKLGVIDVPTVKAIELKKAEATPRMMGRYAFELWIGHELLDRIRFNVPGAGDGPRAEDRRPLKGPRTDRVTTTFQVRITDNPRATSARFVDRATGEIRHLAWPPENGKLVFVATAAASPVASPPPPDDGASTGAEASGGAADLGRRAFAGVGAVETKPGAATVPFPSLLPQPVPIVPPTAIVPAPAPPPIVPEASPAQPAPASPPRKPKR